MIVLKIGGDIFRRGLGRSLADDIRRVREEMGEKMVIVHGGGDEVTEIAEKLGKKQIFVTSPEGIRSRYTDEETVEIYAMVMAGRINKAIVKWLISAGIPAVGLSGIDGSILVAERKRKLVIVDERGRKRIIDGGFTGKISIVKPELLMILLEENYVPVIAPIAIGIENEYLNVDSDRAAGQIAGALMAEKLIFLTDVPGIRIGEEYLKKISLREAKELLPKIGPGMNMKVIASIEAIEAGAKEAIIACGLTQDPITSALNGLNGTVITTE
ncbi:MAG: [LysW]-aminoadipate/[LysW]-glutamate kinase [Candidatus Bathyarchaeia archaeon]|nr:[LysW]-aminoadipate/[LysW]-glutamate kinase [Candidatus Bathyarchaeota archaeon]